MHLARGEVLSAPPNFSTYNMKCCWAIAVHTTGLSITLGIWGIGIELMVAAHHWVTFFFFLKLWLQMPGNVFPGARRLGQENFGEHSEEFARS
jgi:hypothetical protein